MWASSFVRTAWRECWICVFAWALSACAGSGSESGDDEAEQPPVQSKQLMDRVAGKACDSDKDCGNGSCQREVPAFPGLMRAAQPAQGGFCSFPCGINIDCGEGGVCIGAGTSALSFEAAYGKGLCAAYCDESTTCRDGYSCLDPFGNVIGGDSGTVITAGSCQPPPPSPNMD